MSALLRKNKETSSLIKRRVKHRGKASKHEICPSSSAAILILLWNFVVSFSYHLYFYPGHLVVILSDYSGLGFSYSRAVIYSLLALLLLTYPLAGLAGDIKYERFKVFSKGLASLMVLIPVIFILGNVISPSVWPFYVALNIASLIGLVIFYANAVPLAMDQLHDAPTDESSAFIYWYILVDNAAFFCRTFSLILDPFFEYTTSTIAIIYSFNGSVAILSFIIISSGVCLFIV